MLLRDYRSACTYYWWRRATRLCLISPRGDYERTGGMCTTTVLGMLGTDGFAKELTTLYAKAKAIDDDGLSAYMLTSYYGLPTKTLMNSVADDLIFIDKVIGCKLAMSDDRSPFPTEQEILRIIHQVRLGGFTSGKGGILHIHLGALPEGIEPYSILLVTILH